MNLGTADPLLPFVWGWYNTPILIHKRNGQAIGYYTFEIAGNSCFDTTCKFLS
jgi:hypothetical protein